MLGPPASATTAGQVCITEHARSTLTDVDVGVGIAVVGVRGPAEGAYTIEGKHVGLEYTEGPEAMPT